MKVIIQIPCYNEEPTLEVTLRALPCQIPGVDIVEYLVIDDGSTDRTAEVARKAGVDHVIRLTGNKGLARAFMAGLDECLRRGADIIVNTDGDNQYCGADIPKLIESILLGQADMVVGCRRIEDISYFSPMKKRLQRWGSHTVQRLSGLEIPDATSGFRAFSREAALRLNVISHFTYTIETLIQAGKKGIVTRCVPVRVNGKLRESKLFKGSHQYLRRAIPDMLRIYATYEPLKVFAGIGVVLTIAGLVPLVRFLYLYSIGQGGGHVQSLVIGGVLVLVGFETMIMGLLGDLISANRHLVESTLYRLRRSEMQSQLQSQMSHKKELRAS
jgi:glycosyltransferase involved in cell wall biosynthesis